MLLRKGELYRLIRRVDPASILLEVEQKLDLMQALFNPSMHDADGGHSG